MINFIGDNFCQMCDLSSSDGLKIVIRLMTGRLSINVTFKSALPIRHIGSAPRSSLSDQECHSINRVPPCS